MTFARAQNRDTVPLSELMSQLGRDCNLPPLLLLQILRPRLRIRPPISRPQVGKRPIRGSQKGKVLETPTAYALENASFVALFMR